MNKKTTCGSSDHGRRHYFDRPANVRRVLLLFYLVCAGLLLADFWGPRHIEYPLESLPGFYAVYGFVGCVSLVMAAKELRRLVMRREDYYDAEHPGPNSPDLEKQDPGNSGGES